MVNSTVNSILLLSIGISVFNLNETFDDNGSSSLKIYTENDNSAKPGEIIYFTANLCSVENLDNFNVETSQPSANGEENFSFSFNERTTSAAVNYYYIVSENAKIGSEITITFYLNTGKTITKKQEVIKIKNENAKIFQN